MNTYIHSNMFTKRNMLYLVVLLALFCIGIFTLHSQLLDSEERSHVFRTSSVLPEEIVKLYNYTEGYGDLNGPLVRQEDPRLVAKLATKFLIPPKHRDVPYHLEDPVVHDTSMGQAEKIMKLLNYKKNGFFIECGALDGETRSNTLVFERELGWNGLLIEADPFNFASMVTKNRKAYLSPSCLSIIVLPQYSKYYPASISVDPAGHSLSLYLQVSFQQLHNMGKISNSPVGQNKPGYVDVQCFPFYTYLLALNRTLIDYFSLDVEGNELDVLETIPFDKVDIQVRYWTGWTSRGDIGQGERPGEILDRVNVQGRYWTGWTSRGDIGQGGRPGEILDRTLSVEFVHVAKGKEYLQMFMEKKGYVVDSEVTHSDNLANDFIFIKSTLRALDP
uniref:Methyltransferase FkbM domain-containing protein n=1 Tax=Timema genevievae TaxID=629358 RepID=A0A7R9K4Y0_TIMGE|nr:unnamed protein product [Timema genevievae]